MPIVTLPPFLCQLGAPGKPGDEIHKAPAVVDLRALVDSRHLAVETHLDHAGCRLEESSEKCRVLALGRIALENHDARSHRPHVVERGRPFSDHPEDLDRAICPKQTREAFSEEGIAVDDRYSHSAHDRLMVSILTVGGRPDGSQDPGGRSCAWKMDRLSDGPSWGKPVGRTT